MRWKFGHYGRIFRRLWTILMYSQVVSPLLAGLAILTASALGIDTDNIQSSITESPENIDLSVDRLELIDKEDLGRLSRKGGVVDSCCKQPVHRACPHGHTPRREKCESMDTSLSTCSSLSLECLNCDCDYSCLYGETSQANCTVLEGLECKGDRVFTREFTCTYCYLTEKPVCSTSHAASCKSTAPVTQRSHWYVANCSSRKNTVCLGSARFSKRLECSWTEGYSWKTALILSITLGGFGADRFYLGYWQEGIGKLFSFGGLGVWTLVDVILVAVRYIGPADGSLYI